LVLFIKLLLMKTGYIFFYVALFFTPASPAIAQFTAQNNFKFKTYTANEGLVHNYTKKCRQDSKGFLWIITQHGLSRFDGLNFKNFEHNNADSTSLPQNDLEDIAIDSNDNIWLSYKSGLCFYDQINHRFKKIKPYDHDIKSYVIVFDKKRNCIWSVNFTGYSKVNCSNFSVESFTFKQAETAYNDKINFLLLDSKDRLWIPYARARYHCISLSSAKQYFHNERLQPTSFYEDNEKNIWMTAWHTGFRKVYPNDTVHQFEKYGDPYLRISSSPYEFISQAVTQSNGLGGQNMLWVIKYDDGIFLFDKIAGKFVKQFYYDANNKNGTATDFNEYIFTDKNDNIWICTWYGITKVNKLEQQFASRELPELKDQLNNWVSGFADDPYQKNILWMSVCGMGIVKYDQPSNKILHRYGFYYDDSRALLTGNDNNYDWRWTTDLYTDSYNQIWSTTYAGLFKIKHSVVSKITLINKEGDFIYPRLSKELGKGNIWVVGRQGIFKVNAVTDKYSFFADEEDKQNNFYDIEQLDNDNLVLASDSGIKLFNSVSNKFSALNDHDFFSGVAEKTCRSIEVIDNKLYIGSLAGLRVYDPLTKITTVLGKNQGIDKVDECRLKKDINGNLWIITSHGLFKYNPPQKTFEKFTTHDGIYSLSEEPATFFSYNNLFNIGYRMAVTSFDPLQVNINSKTVYPVITDIMINGSILNEPLGLVQKDPLQLNYNQNEVILNYTAPDFTNTDKITFAYQLQGYDKEWITAGTRRTVTYNNLLPGHYTFKLKAANSSGLWNENYTAFKFYIKPALWQRWWFWPLLATLFIAGVVVIAKKRVEVIRVKEKQKTALNKTMAELETKMLRSQMNPHFIFNSLNSVQKYIWENKEEDAAEYLARFAKLIRAILENSRKETISLGEEINVMKLYVELEHRRSNAHFDYSIKVDENLPQDNLQIPPLLMQPFIENAIWHGLNKKATKGNLTITITQKDNQLICIIDDDGVGRQPKVENKGDEKKSLGLAITQQRINRLMETTRQHASVIIEDKKQNAVAAGTKVIITLPLQMQ
jgi:ligand-binding sensor domain-containing protein